MKMFSHFLLRAAPPTLRFSWAGAMEAPRRWTGRRQIGEKKPIPLSLNFQINSRYRNCRRLMPCKTIIAILSLVVNAVISFAENSNQNGGIGISLCGADFRDLKDIHPNGPAAKAGVLIGDYLTHVDGKDVTEKTFEEVLDLIRGPAGSRVSITLKKKGSKETRVTTIERVNLSALQTTEENSEAKPIEKLSPTAQMLPKQLKEVVTADDDTFRSVIFLDEEKLILDRTENKIAGEIFSVIQKLYLNEVPTVILERRIDGSIDLETTINVPSDVQILRDQRTPRRWIFYKKDYSAILGYFVEDDKGLIRPYTRSEFEDK